jgi:hypothetical protein
LCAPPGLCYAPGVKSLKVRFAEEASMRAEISDLNAAVKQSTALLRRRL